MIKSVVNDSFFSLCSVSTFKEIINTSMTNLIHSKRD